MSLISPYRKFTAKQRTDAVLAGVSKFVDVRQDDTNFLHRQLIHVMQKVQEVRYPGDIMRAAFPMNTEGGSGLESINYQVLDYTGKFKVLGTQANDLQEVNSKLSEVPNKVSIYGAAYGYSQFDLERAIRGRVPLDARKGRAIRLAYEKTLNDLAINGDADNADLKGLFDYTLNSVTLPTGTWLTATGQQILDDCLAVINDVLTVTEDFEADTLLMDVESYTYVTTKRISDGNDLTIAEYIKRNTMVDTILRSSRLSSITSAGNSLSADRVMLAYPRNEMILEYMLPRPFQQFPTFQDGMQYCVPVVFDTAGMFVYHPQAIAFATGM